MKKLIVALVIFISFVSKADQKCNPSFDDNGNLISCTDKDISGERAPAGEEEFIEQSEIAPDSGYEKPLDDSDF